ncbi:MAG: hypothetical protein ACFFCJ_01165 [Promethearchaeota archaeon]
MEILPKEGNFEAVYKVVMLGDPNPDLDKLVTKVTTGRFEEEHHHTLGIEVLIYNVTLENQPFKIFLYNLVCSDQFVEVRTQYCQGASGTLYHYNIAEPHSFDHLPDHLASVQSAVNTPIPGLLIGHWPNPTHPRQVTTPQGQHFANQHHLRFYELTPHTPSPTTTIKTALNNLTKDMNKPFPQKTHP